MSPTQPIQQTSLSLIMNPLALLENCKSHILSSCPLLGRVSSNWKVLLMDLSTIICITSFALSFLLGSSLYCAAFFIASIASGVGAFYMRQIATMADLESTKERFESLARNLQGENSRLTETRQELSRENTLFRESNQTLVQTNTRLNQQVTQLTLQVTQLRESAEKIRSEIVRFQQENGHLNTNVRGFSESLRTLDQQILNSRSLCEQIAGHLASQQQGLGEQLQELGRYLSDLRAEGRVHERIQELASLQTQVTEAAGRLHNIQLQYSAERAHFQAIREALVQLKEQFDRAIREASGHMQSNNQQFRDNVNALGAERQRINEILSRHLAR